MTASCFVTVTDSMMEHVPRCIAPFLLSVLLHLSFLLNGDLSVQKEQCQDLPVLGLGENYRVHCVLDICSHPCPMALTLST